ncbi:D-alanyl-D-alanine carboxypeptidase family protein [Spirillospora sp. NPDC048911]|uniref:D-alanyl-D-alanine carboxypeptidase family protein n=1 Tax=Spirillospora sp. NPDC048911 TaxID=3364527 RepID=UPI00371E38A7
MKETRHEPESADKAADPTEPVTDSVGDAPDRTDTAEFPLPQPAPADEAPAGPDEVTPDGEALSAILGVPATPEPEEAPAEAEASAPEETEPEPAEPEPAEAEAEPAEAEAPTAAEEPRSSAPDTDPDRGSWTIEDPGVTAALDEVLADNAPQTVDPDHTATDPVLQASPPDAPEPEASAPESEAAASAPTPETPAAPAEPTPEPEAPAPQTPTAPPAPAVAEPAAPEPTSAESAPTPAAQEPGPAAPASPAPEPEALTPPAQTSSAPPSPAPAPQPPASPPSAPAAPAPQASAPAAPAPQAPAPAHSSSASAPPAPAAPPPAPGRHAAPPAPPAHAPQPPAPPASPQGGPSSWGATVEWGAGAPAPVDPDETTKDQPPTLRQVTEWRAAVAPPRTDVPEPSQAWGSPPAVQPDQSFQEGWGAAADQASTTQTDLPRRSAAPTVETPLSHAPQPTSTDSGQWAVPWAGQEEAEAPPKKKRRGWLIATVLVVVLLAGGAVAGQLLRPLPKPTVTLTMAKTSHTFAGAKPVLAWPAQGQSALFVDGVGTMGSAGGSTPIPTASVAKTMTAYVFLKSHPLASGQPGPTYTISREAAMRLPGQKRRGESLLDVKMGQRLTERKALEALMIISANDVAHELARWDAGNPQAFVAKMNAAARQLGMTSTRYTDPSGYDSRTVSTAADQVKLLRAAMRIPAFAEIVGKRMYVPDNGGVTRVGGNMLLGQLGVVGGKTGYTDAAGGNYIFAARKRVGDVNALIVGAVMGQRSASAVGAIDAAKNLVAGAENALVSATLAPAGQQVAEVDDGLGGTTPLTAKTPLTVIGWPGLTVPVTVKATAPHEAAQGTQVGTVSAGASRVPLVLGAELTEPAIIKRLVRLAD